ncbi:hypothetical protein ACJMK2_028710 [Sinanodonta woodiana]|uniref:Uncharacterized protein n=1 Tax=Sinanodonta woodiana TaxID=1069815 RepID=A0ABD3X8F8_SINWO
MADSVVRQRIQSEGEGISSNKDDTSQSDHDGYHTDSELSLSDDDKEDIRDIDDEFVGRREYMRAVKASGVGFPSSYILRNLPTTHLSLKNHNIGLEATRPLCHALKNNLRVEMLDLQGNDLGFKGASLVMEMLLENVTISNLNLAENNLGNVGARAIGNTLPRLNLLIHLNLSGNKIGDPGMETMAPGIALNTSIERLNLSYNEFEERGGKLLGGALGMYYEIFFDFNAVYYWRTSDDSLY